MTTPNEGCVDATTLENAVSETSGRRWFALIFLYSLLRGERA